MLEMGIRCQMHVDEMQFGFMRGQVSTDAIFIIMRQIMEKHQAKKMKLYLSFVDLKKSFIRVPLPTETGDEEIGRSDGIA